MADRENSPPRPAATSTERRRSSISASTLSELFSRPSFSAGANGASNSPPSYPGPITSAAAQAQRRRLSLTTLGLSASPNQTSPFTQARSRGESLSSATSGSVDESPFEDEGSASATSMPPTPFARRLSFGAQALRDVRAGGNRNVGNANGRSSIAKPKSPPTTTKSRGLSCSSPLAQSPSSLLFSSSVYDYLSGARAGDPHSNTLLALSETEELTTFPCAGDGFNFADNLKTRAERASISGPSMPVPSHHRAKSAAAMEPPIREVPKPAKAPDAFQERILKGDFYMD